MSGSDTMDRLKQFVKKIGDVLGRLPTRRIDIGLAVLVTALGLVMYSYVNLGQSGRAGFSFIRSDSSWVSSWKMR